MYFARNAVYHLCHHFGLAGQEILFPAYFHGVELEALLAAGARTRFFPVHAGMRVDPEEVLALVRPETRAIYVIHYVGFPGPVAELRRACDDRGLILIEDCALSLLSRRDDVPLGSFGDAAVFSIYKSLPTPDGGAVRLRVPAGWDRQSLRKPSMFTVLANATDPMLRYLELRTGQPGRMARQTVKRVRDRAMRDGHFEYVRVGTDSFQEETSDIGISRLSRLILRNQDFSAIFDRRRRNYRLWWQLLGDVAPPVTGELADGTCPLFYPLMVDDKAAFRTRLAERGLMTVNFWSFFHPLVPKGTFPMVDELRQKVLELPCHQDMTPDAVERAAAIVRATLKR